MPGLLAGLSGPVTVANLTAAAGVVTGAEGWWPCLTLTWRTPVPASVTRIVAQVRERGSSGVVAETVVTPGDGAASVVNGVSVGQHLQVRLAPAGAPGLRFQPTPWVDVTTPWDALIAAAAGAGVPSATGGVVATSTQTGAAGDFVNIYDVSGAAKVRLADGSDATKPADGFILTAMTSGNPVTVWTGGVNTAVSPSAAGQVWLSETTPGGYQTGAPSDTAYGHLNQLLGPAIPGTGVAFQRGYPFPV